ncbi:hypothetical protein MMC22_002477 [Lobaria immixta]|nr:hypothetical protein [Lobaria immixta]
MNEVHEMAINAVARISRRDPSTIHLLESLFGKDPARYRTVSGNMETLALSLSPSDFVIICDDLMVNIEPDLSTNLTPDPRGIWVDNIHKWHMPYDEYRPCNPLRKPGSTAGVVSKIGAKVILDRYIYLCPDTLDRPKGRSLAPYKDQVLAGKRIDDYVLTPSILFHELLHTDPRVPVQHPANEELRQDPPVHLASDSASLKFSPRVEAYGFAMCRELAYQSPDLALQNPDNTALCALGKPDSNLAKHRQKEENLLIRLDSRSLLA